ncbi:MAG: YncE family protein [Abitibacteriaceae bacterium]|nr:YncE family protein [Abditibacteriaceae bacterium]
MMRRWSVIWLVATLMLVACGKKEQVYSQTTPLPAAPVTQPHEVSVSKGQPHSLPLRLVQTIPLLDVEGRIDHLAVDVQGQRLFVAALGNNSLEVVDLRAGQRVHSIPNLQEPQGVAFVPSLNRIFVANGQSGTCDIFDGKSFNLIKGVKLGDDADNVRYDSTAKRIYVGYGDGALDILNPATGERLGDIKLDGHPESFQLEKSGSRLFVNVPGADHIAIIDRAKATRITTWPLVNARSNFPMALDGTHHRLFIGCRNPAQMLVYDTVSGKLVTRAKIDGDTDDIFYDAAHQLIYAACDEGFIDVIEQVDADHYHPIARIATVTGARTALFVPELRRLYLAVRRQGQQQAAVYAYAVPESGH